MDVEVVVVGAVLIVMSVVFAVVMALIHLRGMRQKNNGKIGKLRNCAKPQPSDSD